MNTISLHKVISPILISSFLLGVAVSATPEEKTGVEGKLNGNKGSTLKEKSLDQLLLDLGSPDFAEREAAANQIWAKGDAALPALAKKLKAREPEVRMRARFLYEYIIAGILPDSSKELIEIVERIRDEDDVTRVEAELEMLKDEGGYRQIVYLYKVHRVAAVKQLLLSHSLRHLDQVVIEPLRQRDWQEVELILRELPMRGQVAKSMVMLYQMQGKLDQLVADTLAAGEVESEILFHAYVVQRDFQKLEQWAVASGSSRVLAQLQVIQGNPQMLIEDFIKRKTLRNMKQLRGRHRKPFTELGFELARAIDSGNLSNETKYFQDLKNLLKVGGNSREMIEQQTALLVNGESDFLNHRMRQIFLALGDERFRYQLSSYIEYNELPDVLMKVLDAPEDHSKLGEWAQKLALTAKNDDKKDPFAGSGGYEMRRLYAAAQLFNSRYDRKSVRAILDPLFSLGRDFYKGKELEGKANRYHQMFGHALKLEIGWYAKEQLKHLEPEDIDGVYAYCFDRKDYVDSLREHIVQEEASHEDLEKLFLLNGITRGSQKFKVEQLQQDLFQKIKGIEDEERASSLREAIYISASMRGDVLTLVKMAKQKLKEGEMGYLGDLRSFSFMSGQWAEFCQYAEASEKAGQLKGEAEQEYLKWYVALMKLGKQQEALEKRKEFELLKFAKQNEAALDYFAAILLDSNGMSDQSLVYLENLLLTEPYDSRLYSEILYKLNLSSPIMAEKEMWSKAYSVALVHKHLVMMETQSDPSSFQLLPGFLLQLGNHTDFCKGMMQVAQGDEGGKRFLRRCVEKSVGGGSLAEVFFPALRKAGLMKVHQESYTHASKRMVKVLERYPMSANTYNAYAWLSARAATNLKKAKELSERSLTIAPHKATFIDTLAEVYFAKGDRDKAIEISKRAVAETMKVRSEGQQGSGSALYNNQILRKQLDHFINDPLPRN